MASIRRGYSDDFVIKNSGVGIGTSNPQENLDVVGGALQGQDLKVTGVSTQTAFSGFLRADHQIAENTEFSNINVSSLSGEIIVGTGVTVTIARVGLGTTMVGNGSGTIENTIDTTDITTAGGSQIDTLKVYNTFTPPSGDTNQRPYAPKPGELYYNYDFKTIEFFDGNGWRQVDNTTTAGRAVFGGGNPMSSANQVIDFVNITTLGNAQNFGEMYALRRSGSGMSSSIRGLFGGGASPGPSSNDDTIDYITIASAGNPIDFGNLSTARRNPTGASSSTRGLTAGGYVSAANDTIDYVEIATLGNALDFGNLFQASYYASGAASPTRAIFAGGLSTSSLQSMSFVSFASKGNSAEFGDMISGGGELAQGCSSSVRGIFTGGSGPAPYTKTIEYVTFSSLGNSIHFGELTQARVTFNASTQVRAVLAGGSTPSNVNSIDYITISSAGNAQDFGDLTKERTGACTVSDSHGGLGGF